MRQRKRQCGMTTVEMALVGSLFFTLIFSMLQFANWVLDRTIMMNAALEGARVYLPKTLQTRPVSPPVRSFSPPCLNKGKVIEV